VIHQGGLTELHRRGSSSTVGRGQTRVNVRPRRVARDCKPLRRLQITAVTDIRASAHVPPALGHEAMPKTAEKKLSRRTSCGEGRVGYIGVHVTEGETMTAFQPARRPGWRGRRGGGVPPSARAGGQAQADEARAGGEAAGGEAAGGEARAIAEAPPSATRPTRSPPALRPAPRRRPGRP
jgi:hypothetical protein